MEPGAARVGTAERVALGAVLLLAVAARAPTLGQPLVEAHPFRQTQTAYTALLFARDGIDLLHPRVPVLGPPYELPFGFPLFEALASFPMRLGTSPDMSLRITGLACFLAAAALLWFLVRRLAGPDAAFATLVAFLFSPLALLWGRAAMIDYLALAASLAFLLAGIVWRDRGSRVAWALALTTGVVAMVVKIQVGVFWPVPLVAYEARLRGRRDPWLLALVGVPLAAALAWTRYAEAVRAASPGTAWLTVTALAPFLAGTPAERASLDAWSPIAAGLAAWAIGPALVGLVLFTAPAIRAGAQPLFWSALVASPVLSVLAFQHVWTIHDYYLTAATSAVAVAIGLPAARLWHGAHARAVPLAIVVGAAATSVYVARFFPLPLALLPAALALVLFALVRPRRLAPRSTPHMRVLAAAAIALAVGLVATVDYWGRAYAPVGAANAILSRAAELDALTAPDEDVLMVGDEWSPAVLYYARRRGQMLPTQLRTDDYVAGLHHAGYRTFFSWQPAVDALWPASSWPWIGALAPHTYALGDSRADLRDASVASSDDASAFSATAVAGRSLIDGPVSVRCGAVSEVPAGVAGTWLRLALADRDARVAVLDSDLAALPARAVLVVTPAAAHGDTVRLGCSGAEALTVIAAIDAP